MRVKLTKKRVDEEAPGPQDKLLWDTELRGFGLKVTPAGSKRYVLNYRLNNGRRRRFTLKGYHGSPWTVEEARKEARRMQGKIFQNPREGEAQYDPVANPDINRESITVRELASLYLRKPEDGNEEASPTNKKGQTLRPYTVRDYQRIINSYILPVLGGYRVSTVSQQDVIDLHQSRSHAPRQADYLLAVLSSLFAYAERQGLRQKRTNPCRDVNKLYQDPKHARYLNPDELAKLGDVLNLAERKRKLTVPARNGKPERTEPIDPRALTVIRLMMFTGARLGEVLGLRWADVDMQRGMALLIEHKTSREVGTKSILLPAPAVALLEKTERVEGNPYVIPGNKLKEHLTNPYPTWYAVREVAGIPDARLYDLRHSFASMAVSSGVTLYMVQKLLGHTDPKTTQRYAHMFPDAEKQAAEAMGQTIMQALQPASAQAKRRASKRKG